LGCGNRNDEAQQGSSDGVMGKWLPNRNALAVDRHTNQPVIGPPEITHGGVFKLSVTVWTDD
jgi:hypothetical protein